MMNYGSRFAVPSEDDGKCPPRGLFLHSYFLSERESEQKQGQAIICRPGCSGRTSAASKDAGLMEG